MNDNKQFKEFGLDYGDNVDLLLTLKQKGKAKKESAKKMKDESEESEEEEKTKKSSKKNKGKDTDSKPITVKIWEYKGDPACVLTMKVDETIEELKEQIFKNVHHGAFLAGPDYYLLKYKDDYVEDDEQTFEDLGVKPGWTVNMKWEYDKEMFDEKYYFEWDGPGIIERKRPKRK